MSFAATNTFGSIGSKDVLARSSLIGFDSLINDLLVLGVVSALTLGLFFGSTLMILAGLLEDDLAILFIVRAIVRAGVFLFALLAPTMQTVFSSLLTLKVFGCGGQLAFALRTGFESNGHGAMPPCSLNYSAFYI